MKFAFLCKSKPTSMGKRVAIIGAGIAGLSAAGYLTCKGFEVDVYDKQPVAGGLAALAIPSYRISYNNIDEGVEDLVKSFGVKLYLNTKVMCGERHDEGDDFVKHVVDLRNIVKEYSAVVITTGTWRSRKLGVPGEDAKGVVDALTFLYKLRLAEHGLAEEFWTKPKRVVVVGAGLSAVDAAEEALRLGAEEVYLIYRRTKKEAPAGEYYVDDLIAKGVKWLELAAPTKIIVENGFVKAVEFQRMRLGPPDKTGRPAPIPIPGSEFTIEADLVIPAIGEVSTPPFTQECAEFKQFLDERGYIISKGYRLGNTNMFVAGDVLTGPTKLGEACKHGLYTARDVERFLRGV
jgi:glutamate synthase (NADPH/NADH) small chain